MHVRSLFGRRDARISELDRILGVTRAMEEFSSGVFLLLQRVMITMVAGSAAAIMMPVAVIQYGRFDIDSPESVS